MYHKPLAYGIRARELKRIAEANIELELRHVKIIIDNILEETFKLVRGKMAWWITRFVPRMTGRLRRDLYRHLMTSYVRNSVLRIFIQTSIDYAKKVNEYTTRQVRHKGKKVKYRGKTITLWDPHAIGNFFDIMVKYAANITVTTLKQVKRKYASRTRMTFKEMKIIKLW